MIEYVNVHPPLGSQAVHVRFLQFVQEWPKSIGGQSTAEEWSQTCSSVPRLPGMEGSALWLQLLPAANSKVGSLNEEFYVCDVCLESCKSAMIFDKL